MEVGNMPLTEKKKLVSQIKEAKKPFTLKLYDIVEVNHSDFFAVLIFQGP